MFLCLLLQGVLSPGVLPTSGGVDAGAADRNGGGDQGTGVRELELQIDALYGMPSNATGTIGPSPVRVVQAPVVSSQCVRSHIFVIHFILYT